LTYAAGIRLLHLAATAEQAQNATERERFLELMLAGLLGVPENELTAVTTPRAGVGSAGTPLVA
jgi:hypothetical protein